METIYRTGKIRNLDDAKESRTVQFVISDSSRDRHGTVLNMDNWKLDNFNKNGIVGYQHDVYGAGLCNGPDPDTVIGKGRAWVESDSQRDNGESGKVLVGEVEFEPEDINPLAEKIFKKVLNGTLKATSVGFYPFGGGKLVDGDGNEFKKDSAPYNIGEDETYYYNGQELLEFSIVNIPSNPNALKKSLRNQTANVLHYIKRQIGGGITFGQIEEMRVVDVIKMLERPGRRAEIEPKETKESEETKGGDELPNYGLRKLKILRHKIENKKAIT